MPDRLDLTLPPVEAVDALPSEALPGFVAQLAALSMRAAARLSAPQAPTNGTNGDRMLDIDEASARTGMSRAWLYRNRAGLPFARRIGRKVLFSEAGMARWLATRSRRRLYMHEVSTLPMARSRMGRPPLFKDRTQLMVYLERCALRAIQDAAARDGVSAAEWARRRLIAAAQEGSRMTRTTKQRDARRGRGKGGR